MVSSRIFNDGWFTCGHKISHPLPYNIENSEQGACEWQSD